MLSRTGTVTILCVAAVLGLAGAALAGAGGTGPENQHMRLAQVSIVSAKDLDADFRETIQAQLAEFRKKGHVVIEDDSVIDATKAKSQGKLLAANALQGNTTFSIRQPKWLPSGTLDVGGKAQGPSEKGPWNSIRLFYESRAGNFSIEEWSMSDGEVTMVKETLTETVKGNVATSQRSKLRKSGKDWYSLGWISKGHYLSISGEISPSVAKRIAESID